MRLGDIQLDDLGKRFPADANVQRFRTQARSTAIGAASITAVTAHEDAHMDLVLLGIQPFEKAPHMLVDQGFFLVAQFAEGHVHSHLAAHGLAKVRHVTGILRLGPGIDGTLVERQHAVRNHQIHVVIDRVAEALAALARAERAVEAEQAGLRLDEFFAAGLALKLFVEAELFAAARLPGRFFENHFTGFAITDFDGIDQTLAHAGRDSQAIHQREYRLGEIDIEQRFRRREFEHASRPGTIG